MFAQQMRDSVGRDGLHGKERDRFHTVYSNFILGAVCLLSGGTVGFHERGTDALAPFECKV